MIFSLPGLRLPVLHYRQPATTIQVAIFILLLVVHSYVNPATQDNTADELFAHSTATLNCLLLKPIDEESRAFTEKLKLSLENMDELGVSVVMPDQDKSGSCQDAAQVKVSTPFKGAKSVTVKVFTNRRFVDDTTTESSASEEDLLEKVSKYIVATITMNIRIQIKNFEMLGDDTSGGKYKQLEGTIPNMLTNELSVSPQIVLIDDSDYSAEIMELLGKKSSTVFDQATYVDPEFLIANYTVEGEFGELNDVLYVSVKCTNNKTKQIIVSHGIDVEPIELKVLQDRLSELAAELRAAIELDYLAGQKQDKYISVVANSPFPDTKENREIILEIAHTINRNLSLMDLDGMEVKMDMQKIRGFIDNPLQQDRWIMSHQLEADYLIILDLDRTDRDNLIVTATFFDTNDPRKIDPVVFRSTPAEIDSKIIQDLIQTAEVEKKWIKISDNGKRFTDIEEPFKYRGIFKTLVFNYRIGPSIRLDPDLYSGVGSGILVDLGLGWNPTKSNRWKIEPLHLRLDLLGSDGGGDRMVFGLDLIYLNVLYRMRPHYSKGFYVGGGVGYLGVLRNAPEDINLDGRPGVLLSVGLEQVLKSSRILDWRLELAYGLDEINPKIVGGEEFNGGRPGGLYFTLGSSF